MGLNIEQALQQGVTAHREGKLQDAERLYRAILQSQPLHPDANHNLGVLAVSVNKAEAALPLFKTALEANPKIEQFWLSYIGALIKEQQLDNAKQVLEQAKTQNVSGERLISLEVQLSYKKLNPNTTTVNPPQELLNSLLEHYQAGRLDDAEKLAVSIISEFPKHQFGWKVLGAILGTTGRKSEAVDANQTAVALSPQDAEAHNNLGNTLQELGEFDEALASYAQAIALKPDYNEAHSNLGITLQELARLDEAEASLNQAIALKPDFAPAHYNLGNTLKELGRLNEAEASYNQAITLKPDFAEAHSNLGNTLQQLGRLGEAAASLNQAIALKLDYPEANYNLGITLQELGRLEKAEASYKQAIALKPDFAEAHSNLGNTLQQLGRLDEALASYAQAIALKPDYNEAHSNLGITLQELARLDEAEASLNQAIALKPDFAPAHYNLGNTLKELGRLEKAEASYKQAIALKPDFAEAHNNLGNTLQELGEFDEALESYAQAKALKPDFSEALVNLGDLMHAQGLTEDCLEHFEEAMRIDPQSFRFRWCYTIWQLPKVAVSQGAFRDSYDRFESEIESACMLFDDNSSESATELVGRPFPYYLAYFESNNRSILETHGKLCALMMKKWMARNNIILHDRVSNHLKKKVRIGIVSAHIHYHSVWNAFLKGIVTKLDTTKFELHIFSLSHKNDDQTEIAKQKANKFHADIGELPHWAKKIIHCEIDILFFPEIGMDHKTVQLASMRLAPVQVCSYGHPETSGLPTMDYYISSELLEEENPNAAYSEKLIKLPGLGYYFEPGSLGCSSLDLTEFGLHERAPKLLCLGAPNKFSPLYDSVFIEIIRRVKNCQLIFMHDYLGSSRILEERLRSEIHQAKMAEQERLVFVPQLNREGFNSLMQTSHVLLDPIGFSGLNTAMQAVGCCVPIITREGKFQRTKHASAILKVLELEELIAKSEQEYVSLVAKVVLDPKYLNYVKSKMRLRESLLYANEAPIRALESFFETAAERH